MIIELSVKSHKDDCLFYEELNLPATDYEIQDILHKVRAFDEDVYFDIGVLDCFELPDLTDVGVENPTIGELNIFAKRLKELSDEDITKLNGLFSLKMEDGLYDENGVHIDELINMTYSLDTIMIASNLCGDENLGQFIIERDIDNNIFDMSEEMKEYLDKEKIGRIWKEKLKAEYVDGYCIFMDGFELSKQYVSDENYDSRYKNLNSVFRLEVSEPPIGDEDTQKTLN